MNQSNLVACHCRFDIHVCVTCTLLSTRGRSMMVQNVCMQCYKCMHEMFALHTDHSDVGQILNSRLTVVKIAREAWSSSDPKVNLHVQYFNSHTCVHLPLKLLLPLVWYIIIIINVPTK